MPLSAKNKFLQAPNRHEPLTIECPHCGCEDVIRDSDGNWCEGCSTVIGGAYVDTDRGYDRYDGSGKVRLYGGYEEAYMADDTEAGEYEFATTENDTLL